MPLNLRVSIMRGVGLDLCEGDANVESGLLKRMNQLLVKRHGLNIVRLRRSDRILDPELTAYTNHYCKHYLRVHSVCLHSSVFTYGSKYINCPGLPVTWFLKSCLRRGDVNREILTNSFEGSVI